MPFLVDWIVNGDNSGHIQSLILGAVLFIAAVQLFALGVIGDLLAGQRVMTQRVFERVRRVELKLGVEPSHYEQGGAPPARLRPTRRGSRGSAPELRARSGSADATAAAVDYGKTAGFLTVGVGLTGVITYLYFAIASHTLSKVDYGEITVVWSAVFITVSTLYRPIDQLLSRHISERRTRGEPIAQPVRVAAIIQLGLGVAFAVLALALRSPIQDDLLSGNETLYWVYFSAVLGYAASYFARGFLAGERQFGLFSMLILSESIFRTAFAVVVAIGLFEGQSVVALGIVAAPCLSLIVVPLAFARRAQTTRRAAPRIRRRERVRRPEFSLAHGTGFATAVLLIMFSEQTFLNAGPLLVRATDGAAAAGFIFNVLMVARAPLQLFQAVSTSILPHLTGLHHSAEEGSEAAFHSSIRMVILAVAAFTAAVALAVLAFGPQLMQLAFGDEVRL